MQRQYRTKLLVGAILIGVASAGIGGDDTYKFMPDGGRSLLLRLLGDGDITKIAAKDQSAEAWTDWALASAPDLGEQAIETLAGYAELNFPLAPQDIAMIAETGDTSLLPPDGKDLAINQCQFCHSLFSGYLMHKRDETGWRGTFKAPFHTEIPMSDIERHTFARYSAINMPLKVDDVPPELRF